MPARALCPHPGGAAGALLLTVALAVMLVTSSSAPATSTFSSPSLYTNPVLDMDFPDPTVIRGGDGLFYAYATMGNGHRIQVASSPDLVSWSYHGEALPTPPTWHQGGATWAPDVTFVSGRGYLMFFAASAGPSGQPMCIGVAESAAGTGPFVDVRGTPLLCSNASKPFGAIDPKLFLDPNNNNNNSATLYWGSDGIPIGARALNATTLVDFADGSSAMAVVPTDPGRPFEALVEGAWLHFSRGAYYLFYSGDNCCNPNAHYAVLVARGPTPHGPFTKLGTAMGTNDSTILVRGPNTNAPGHNSVVTDDAGVDWMFYHSMVAPDENGPSRKLCLDRISYNETATAGSWPWVGVPSTTPQQAPTVTRRGGRRLEGEGSWPAPEARGREREGGRD
jgi:arabinan endo-1,5-alpha-L-arabinosidase